jgi:hypothetical protein
MADALTVKFDGGSADATLAAMQAELEALVRPTAQAGAEVLYREVKIRVASIGKVTGNLGASIYQVYSRDNSNDVRATYHVSWNARKAPHGHLVEYGHIQTRKVYVGSDGKWYTSKDPLPGGPRRVGARPFLRPAWDAKGAAAAEAMLVHYTEGMQRLLAGLT